ncbi:phage portal protein [Clostridium butyricum]
METVEERQAKSVRDTLLNLPWNEIRERRQVLRDYIFYKGKSEDLEAAKNNPVLYGQNWPIDDNIDYKPTQEIRNKIKPLLRKQARWMFGKEPTLVFKADDLKDKDNCEDLRKYIEDVFENNDFWNNTRKAFLEATIKKRVLLRAEANPGQPIVIKYESIENFYYKEKNGKLLKVIFFEEDEQNVFKEEDKDKVYYLHTYYYKPLERTLDAENKIVEYKPFYKKETYINTELQEDKTLDNEITISKTIPCWLIKNAGELNNKFGESDVTDLVDSQNQYNKRNSDFADALRFQMFGAEAIIDGKEDDVNKLTVAPNALHAIRTSDEAMERGKQATIQRQEYNIGNSGAIDAYLNRCDSDMREMLDMPKITDLNNIPSAKAMGYLYNDLMARCDEKFNDWEKPLLNLIDFIIEVGSFCYPGIFDKYWLLMNYTKIIKRNVPLPSDEDDKKDKAMDEVDRKVRSRKSYIKEFTNEEDAEKAFEEILEETTMLQNAQDSMLKDTNSEIDDINKQLEDEE